MLISDLIQRRARNSPDLTFWEQGEVHLSYAELDRGAARVARALWAAGLQPGDTAVICCDNGPEYAVAHCGAAYAGVLLAHLNARYTPGELALLLEHSGARMVFFSPAQAPALESFGRAFPHIKPWVCLPSLRFGPDPKDAPRWSSAWEKWLAPHEDAPLSAEEQRRLPTDPEAPFQLLYTSGTTGTPKGALISHRAKLRQGATHALNLGLVEGDRLLSSLPLYHQYAQWLVLVAAPLAGATVVSQERFDAEQMWAALSSERITHLPLVPTTLYRLLDAADAAAAGAAGYTAPHLRSIVYGGAPVAAERMPRVRARFPGVRLFQGFGQTETGYCLGLHDADHDRRPESLGRPDLFSEVRLLDAVGRDVPDGEVGEIVARTPYLMNGYHQDQAATEAYFGFGAGWGRTGDLAVRDAEGFYTLAGRRDDLILRGGVNIYPAEIERVLHEHPQVAEAAVLGLPDPDLGQVPVAAVVRVPGTALTPEQITAHCRAHLAPFKVPVRVLLVDALPHTPSGKVRKHDLRPRLEAAYARD